MESALRAALQRLDRCWLEALLSIDNGHRANGIDCGHGHEAIFVGYRSKVLDTVLVRSGWGAPGTTARGGAAGSHRGIGSWAWRAPR